MSTKTEAFRPFRRRQTFQMLRGCCGPQAEAAQPGEAAHYLGTRPPAAMKIIPRHYDSCSTLQKLWVVAAILKGINHPNHLSWLLKDTADPPTRVLCPGMCEQRRGTSYCSKTGCRRRKSRSGSTRAYWCTSATGNALCPETWSWKICSWMLAWTLS